MIALISSRSVGNATIALLSRGKHVTIGGSGLKLCRQPVNIPPTDD